jgi:hypothetical protein
MVLSHVHRTNTGILLGAVYELGITAVAISKRGKISYAVYHDIASPDPTTHIDRMSNRSRNLEPYCGYCILANAVLGDQTSQLGGQFVRVTQVGDKARLNPLATLFTCGCCGLECISKRIK